MGITTRKLTEHLNQAIAHGKVSVKDANELLLGTGYTPQSAPPEIRNLLANALRKNLDHFDPGAQQALDAFINPAGTTSALDDGLQVSSDNPAIMASLAGMAQYGASYGKLFVKGASGGDLHQNFAGDCYFDASVASLAHAQPQALKKLFTENADGTVTVTFQQHNADGSFTPVPITVDRSVPEGGEALAPYGFDGKPVFDSAGKPGELWPLLIEKAFAKWKGSYDAIGNGGWPSEALAAVTGKPVTTLDTTQTAPDDLFAQLTAATASKQPVVCYTYPMAGHEADFQATGTSDVYGQAMTNVVDSHAYSIFGTQTDPSGQRYVILRNPWGMHEPGSDGHDDGVFRLPLDQFLKLYPSVSFTSPPALPPRPPIAG